MKKTLAIVITSLLVGACSSGGSNGNGAATQAASGSATATSSAERQQSSDQQRQADDNAQVSSGESRSQASASANTAGQEKAHGQSGLNADTEKLSYVLGYEMGKGLNRIPAQVDGKQVITGVQAGLQGKSPQYSKAQMEQAMKSFQQYLIAQQQAARKRQQPAEVVESSETVVVEKEKPEQTGTSVSS